MGARVEERSSYLDLVSGWNGGSEFVEEVFTNSLLFCGEEFYLDISSRMGCGGAAKKTVEISLQMIAPRMCGTQNSHS